MKLYFITYKLPEDPFSSNEYIVAEDMCEATSASVDKHKDSLVAVSLKQTEIDIFTKKSFQDLAKELLDLMGKS